MAYYLVNYENVMSAGLNGLHDLTENDTVIIFYSENSNKLTFETHYQLTETKSAVQYQKAESGTKNALDFQLASYLGYLISDTYTAENEKYYIVTKDNGFSVLKKYWNKRNICIDIICDLTGLQIHSESEKITAESDTEKSLAKVLSGYINSKDEINTVIQIIKNAETKTEIISNLSNLYKDKRVNNIYEAIMPYIEDKE